MLHASVLTQAEHRGGGWGEGEGAGGRGPPEQTHDATHGPSVTLLKATPPPTTGACSYRHYLHGGDTHKNTQ